MIRVLILSLFAAGGCTQHVGYGVDEFVKHPPEIVKGKRIGLITNHTGQNSAGQSDIDLIRSMKSVKLTALFGPEHGIRGNAEPGEKLVDGVDAKTGLPVYSLYGAIRKPTPEMLKDVDVLVFDIQDVGARCYTYPSTMAKGMEAAKENNIPFVVLDRPNPIGGEKVEGNLLDPKYSTFVGLYRMPMVHGLSMGEWAQLANKEFGIGCNLTVVKAPGWKRSQWWRDTKLPWTTPSPNLPTPESVIHYPGTVFFEGTNLSCGRGTDYPFEQVGAPWLNSEKVIEAMNAAGVPGVKFEAVMFTPKPMGDKKYDNQLCQGIRLKVLDRNVYQPVRTNAILIDRIHAIHPQEFKFRESHFDRLAGTDQLRLSILDGKLEKFLAEWKRDEDAFRQTRKPYLLYE